MVCVSVTDTSHSFSEHDVLSYTCDMLYVCWWWTSSDISTKAAGFIIDPVECTAIDRTGGDDGIDRNLVATRR